MDEKAKSKGKRKNNAGGFTCSKLKNQHMRRTRRKNLARKNKRG